MTVKLQKLLEATPAKVAERAKRLNFKYSSKNKDGRVRHQGNYCRGFYVDAYLAADEKKGNSGTPYRLMIKNFGTRKNPEDWLFKMESRVWVHCTCPYFTYYLETALFAQGASHGPEDGLSNGNYPVIRNPSMRPYLCKHLYATLMNLIARERNKKIYKPIF